MTASAPRDSVIAVVGDGFGSLLVQVTARYLGFENREITVFGPSDNARFDTNERICKSPNSASVLLPINGTIHRSMLQR